MCPGAQEATPWSKAPVQPDHVPGVGLALTTPCVLHLGLLNLNCAEWEDGGNSLLCPTLFSLWHSEQSRYERTSLQPGGPSSGCS